MVCTEESFLDNHKLDLVTLICKEYLKMRLHYVAKMKNSIIVSKRILLIYLILIYYIINNKKIFFYPSKCIILCICICYYEVIKI